jgi:hypothetical protein
MKEITYDFHGALRVHIRGLSRWTLEAFNCLHSQFRAKTGSAREPDLSVDIGPFQPDLAGCANVDHRYFVKQGYVYYRGTDKGLRWEAEISGLDGLPDAPVKVRFFAPLANRFRFPWCFFPDLVLTLYVLNPLLERMLWQRGYFLLHSAGVERAGRACLIAGRGGAHKTTFTMALLRKGWKLLGDDMVIVNRGRVLCFPTVAQELDFLVRRQTTEDMGLSARFGLFRHLAANPPLKLPVADSAVPAALNIVIVRDIESPVVRGDLDLEAVVQSLVANHLMERITYVGFKFSTNAYLEAYAYAFPESASGADAGYPEDLAAALRTALSGASFRVLEVPLKWDTRNLDLILDG